MWKSPKWVEISRENCKQVFVKSTMLFPQAQL